jgi:hypothetical protein
MGGKQSLPISAEMNLRAIHRHEVSTLRVFNAGESVGGSMTVNAMQ